MIVYVILPYDRWRAFKAAGTNPEAEEDDGGERPLVRPWLRRQIADRTGLDAADVHPVYAWMSRPPSSWMWPPKRAVLKVRVADELVVPIDDDAYIGVLNTMGNGWVDEDAGPESMFDVRHTPEDRLRALIAPRLTLEMVRKAAVYRWSVRLRRRRQRAS